MKNLLSKSFGLGILAYTQLGMFSDNYNISKLKVLVNNKFSKKFLKFHQL